MKTLYESLLDDFDDLEKKSNSDIKSSIIDFIRNNYSGIEKITISDKINDNGKYVVDIKGYDIDIQTSSRQNIKKLTNDFFIFGIIKGNFECGYCNSLKTLEGAPKEVEGDFKCTHCHSLISLEGAPQNVGGDFACYTCSKLKSLKGAPQKVGGDFVCDWCESLISLEDSPKEVGKDFQCNYCDSLKSLEGAPQKVGQTFNCNSCKKLISLEGAPERVYSFRCSSCKGKFQESDVRKYCKEAVKIVAK